jgi:hypothetical protein
MLLLALLVLQSIVHVESQTVAVSTDDNAFLCKTKADCSQYYAGSASQGEW